MVSLVKSYAGLFSLFSSIRLWELVPKSPSSIDLSVYVPLANESWRLNPGFLLPISQASREVTGSARPGNRGRQRRLLTQGLRLLWTVTWRGGWDPFLWGSCSPLAHTPDLVVAFAPKPSEHQCWAACLFLVILNRDNLPACTVLEISSAQDYYWFCPWSKLNKIKRWKLSSLSRFKKYHFWFVVYIENFLKQQQQQK